MQMRSAPRAARRRAKGSLLAVGFWPMAKMPARVSSLSASATIWPSRVDGIGAGTDDAGVVEQIEVQAKYAGYLDRQRDEIERQKRNDETSIPERFDFANVRGLSAEVTAKLVAVQPRTIGQAMRISGVTPAAISLLLVHLKRGGRRVA